MKISVQSTVFQMMKSSTSLDTPVKSNMALLRVFHIGFIKSMSIHPKEKQ